MKIVPVLHTMRCVMTEVTQDDIPFLRIIVEDDLFQKYIPELYEVVSKAEGLVQFINSLNMYVHKNEGFLWGIRKDNHLIGFIAIIDLSCDPTLMYAMHPAYRNQGYTKECVMKAVSFYSTISKTKLQTEVYQDNIASLSILKACGFKKTNCIGNKYVLSQC